MASPGRVLVTYSAPLIFLSSDQWSQIHRAIAAHMPLRNLHWKTASRPSIRTIQELDVSLVSFDTMRDEHASQIPTSLLEKPLVNIYVVTCEDNDVYKVSVKKQIKDWFTLVSQKKNQEWLILLVVRPDTRAAAGNFFQMRSSVMDKIRADFNIGKRDRCVQLAWSPGVEDPAAWADLIAKLKDGVLSAFDAAVTAREEEVKKLDSQRQMPGWNFCQYTILKASLATSFEGMNLVEDAQIQFEELEASFFHVLRERNLSWFGKLIDLKPGDDTLPLLSLTRKPYRDLLLANTISVFDYRIYLLALQCSLLGKSGRVADAGRKAATFLSGFGRRLHESKDPLPEHFVESWTYASCISVVQQCDKWADGFQLEGALLSTYNSVKGELYELARNQVEKLGVQLGHLPHTPPFTMSLPAPSRPGTPTSTSSASTVKHSGKISCEPILAAMKSRETFDKLYVSVTNRAIAMYDKGGRRKFALKLHGCVAALDLLRARNQEANSTYASLPAHYAHHSWTGLEAFMLLRAMETHAGPDKDRAWAEAALAFLRAHVTIGAQGLLGGLASNVDEKEYLERVVQGLREACADAESDVIVTGHPALVLNVPDTTAKQAEDEDGSYLHVPIRNVLPCDVHVDAVVVHLSGSDNRHFEFASEAQDGLVLVPGDNTVKLFCANPAYGTFALESSDIHLSRVIFHREHRTTQIILPVSSTSSSIAAKPALPTLVRVPRDKRDLEVRITVPSTIHLDEPPRVVVTISTGRNAVTSATLKLSAPANGRFLLREAKLEEPVEDASVENVDEWLVLQSLPCDSSIRIIVPHTHSTGGEGLKVTAQLDYNSMDSTRPTRALKVTQGVSTSLPVEVKVQDIFRGDMLFSKFTIFTVSSQHITIASTRLEVESDISSPLEIHACASPAASLTVTPSKPATFLFKLRSIADRRERDTLHLRIKYRMLREELEAIVDRHIRTALGSSELAHLSGDARARVMRWLETDGSWADLYSITGQLNVGELTNLEGDLKSAVQLVTDSLRKNNRAESRSDGTWREMVIPVDLPFMNVVAADSVLAQIISSAQIHMPSDPKDSDLFAGRPITTRLAIHTSFHWGLANEAAKERGFKMRFDVDVPIADWLVCGRKRGEFLAKDGATYEVAITLLPLRHGLLALPNVTVMPLPLAGSELTMGSMALPSAETYQLHGAQRVLVLPRGGRSTFVLDLAGGG
ncbi:hypothetical protein AURDEDRAFT_71368 [Auricularia subglabra TFB-10046 SS5]|nr:hypothetical protein AURDEDRAFT_71368 [Auricularia subglabra TFB-10046 SS5]